MKIIAGIQARYGSQRLPGKVLFPLGNQPILGHVIDAAWQMPVDNVELLLKGDMQEHWPGSFENISTHTIHYSGHGSCPFSRACNVEADYVVRLCGDQPFVDPKRARRLIDRILLTGADYAGYLVNGRPAATTAYGIYAEVVKVEALLRAQKTEHVTNTIYMNPHQFHCEWIEDDPTVECEYVEDGDRFTMPTHYWSLTIDTILDYYRIKAWYDKGGWPNNPGGNPFKNDARYDWL